MRIVTKSQFIGNFMQILPFLDHPTRHHGPMISKKFLRADSDAALQGTLKFTNCHP